MLACVGVSKTSVIQLAHVSLCPAHPYIRGQTIYSTLEIKLELPNLIVDQHAVLV